MIDNLGLTQIGINNYLEVATRLKNLQKNLKENKKMRFIMPEMVVQIVKAVYPILRPLLEEAVKNTESPWDDTLLSLFDRLFIGDLK